VTTFAATFPNQYPYEVLHDAECKQAQKAKSYTTLSDERAARMLEEVRRDIHWCLRTSKVAYSTYDWTKLGRLNDITVARKVKEQAEEKKRNLAYRVAYLRWALNEATADLTALDGWEPALDEAEKEMEPDRRRVTVTVEVGGSYSTRRY
jgi:hypothetical protein